MGLTAGVAAFASSVAAYAGGYVAPIIEFAPSAAPVAAAGNAPSYWLALIPLALLYFGTRGGSGDDIGSNPSQDLGGTCFCEGTLILANGDWVAVESIRVGDVVTTSKGVQTVLSIGSWRPTQFRDRPSIVDGVRISANHGVQVDGFNVEASAVTSRRGLIDGRSYFHILVEDHSWLYAKADPAGAVLVAESLMMTKDLQMAQDFPHLVGHHAANPVAPRLSKLGERLPAAA
ncbi:Hint domain-containing protein [Paracoccus sp. Ld10]|uniref:Hint domain-containing protein n=1 Tax=Paracoccus sp. Ld10 TaxID=649158 RepID=UPI0038642267